jgi:S-adenosyl methyltransferase
VADSADWLPKNVDLTKPSAARLYDFFLGGAFHFEVDRELGRKVAQSVPGVFDFARLNRAFLWRAVRYLSAQGITQFLDIGSGLPSAGNVHEVAHRENPDAHVVYVDNEPVAVSHSELMLKDNDKATVVEADLREPEKVLAKARASGLLDFDKPIGLLTVAVLHFVPDSDHPNELLATYRDALPDGSYLALSHLTMDAVSEQVTQLVNLYKNTQNPAVPRTIDEVSSLFDGFDIVDPGVVFTPLWHPESPEDVGEDPERSAVYAGIGRKNSRAHHS